MLLNFIYFIFSFFPSVSFLSAFARFEITYLFNKKTKTIKKNKRSSKFSLFESFNNESSEKEKIIKSETEINRNKIQMNKNLNRSLN